MIEEIRTAFAHPARSSGIEAVIGKAMLAAARKEGHRPSLRWLTNPVAWSAPANVDEVCVDIIEALKSGPMSAAQIRKTIHRGQASIKAALARLETDGTVSSQRVRFNGKIFYRRYSLEAAE